ncbi:Putrescine transporter PotE (plasmid) [Asticcacaulis sp. MM231]|uniref:APC family permease n=1 Tax=Asticcacaulis sp. MM231 TaxID=3157666 RepID=UPI0032D591C5
MAAPPPVIPADITVAATLKPRRELGFWGALSANMLNMVGIGPFITIPLALGAMGGPQALIGWILGAVISLSDGFVWAELGAAMPHSGGSYQYLRRLFDEKKLGNMFGFLFLWQSLMNGPLNVAAGAVGFVSYLSYLFPQLKATTLTLCAAALCLLNTWLLYRNIRKIQIISLITTAIVVVSLLWIIFAGMTHFDARIAFDFPPGAFNMTTGFLMGLGSTTLIAVYDYGGYSNVCMLAGEVKQPRKVIPRSILWAIVLIALLYCGLNLSILGVVPWREAMVSKAVVADFMAHLYGRTGGIIVAILIMIAGWGSAYVVLLGYSRIPYAAALEGKFFKIFAAVHPKGHFPTVSLVVMGVASAIACFLSLNALISVLIVVQTLFQYSFQCLAVILRRKQLQEQFQQDYHLSGTGTDAKPYKMPLFPIPALISLAGWIYIVTTSKLIYIFMGMGLFAIGAAIFLGLAFHQKDWPFEAKS